MSEVIPSRYETGLYQSLQASLPRQYELADDIPIGRGGMSLVYEAFDAQKEEPVAVKVANAPRDHGLHNAFYEEAQQMLTLQHENIINVRYAGRTTSTSSRRWRRKAEESVPYIVMERAEDSLKTTTHVQPTRLTVRYLEQAMKGMAYAHGDNQSQAERRNIVHLDLKPPNMLLRDGIVKIADFGSIAMTKSTLLCPQRCAASGEYMSLGVGTPPYMAPEQFTGNQDRAVDIYGMGVTAYHLLSGNLPIYLEQPDSFYEWYRAHATTAVQPMHIPSYASIEAGRIIDELQEPVLRALAKKPEERFSTMSDFRDAVMKAAARAEKLNHRDLSIVTEASRRRGGHHGRHAAPTARHRLPGHIRPAFSPHPNE